MKSNSQQQRCKICFNKDYFNFSVSNEIWEKIVPKRFQNRVVCLVCFDNLATCKNIKYKLSNFSFAGKRHSFDIEFK